MAHRAFILATASPPGVANVQSMDRASFTKKIARCIVFGSTIGEDLLAGGFPRVLFSPCGVLFPPLWCVFPPRCAGAVPPCGLSTPRVALLSWDHLASFRASPRQTWAGSSLAAAGAPQLHASALQQRRRLTHRPANVKAARPLGTHSVKKSTPPCISACGDY